MRTVSAPLLPVPSRTSRQRNILTGLCIAATALMCLFAAAWTYSTPSDNLLATKTALRRVATVNRVPHMASMPIKLKSPTTSRCITPHASLMMPASVPKGSFSPRTYVSPNDRQLAANSLFGLGFGELLVIGGVAALIFGPSKLPELGKQLGSTAKSLGSAVKEFNEELKEELKSEEGEEAAKEEKKEENKE
ncbi:hypothetical protein AAMO2058_000526800 [Amorphochlora amoebiformis]